MTDQSGNPLWRAACVLWIVGFLLLFYSYPPDNNAQVTRSLLWLEAFTHLPSLFNPFDFSHTAADGIEFGWHLLPQRLPFVAAAAVVLATGWTVGTAAGQILGPARFCSPAERLVLSTGTGLSLQSLWTLAIGRAGWLNPWLLIAPGLLSVPFLTIGVLRSRRGTQNPSVSETVCLPDASPASVRLRVLLIALTVPFVLSILVNGVCPPFDFDVREYHLQGPKEWYQAGKITFLEHNVYTSFPFLSEMLSLNGMVLLNDWNDGALAGKQILACFQLLTTAAVFATGRRWFGTVPGLLAAVVYVSVPWTLRISLIAYAEGAVTFYLTAAVLCGSIAVSRPDGERSGILVLQTGFLAGSAMAAKYPGLVFVVVPVTAWFLLPGPRGFRHSLTAALICMAGVILAVGLWLERNREDTGNPVYPLLYSVFGGTDWSPELDARWKRAHSPDSHNPSDIPRYLAGVALGSDWTSGLLFALAVPTLLHLRRSSQMRRLWSMVAWMLITWWALTHRIDRFWIPVIPVLAILAGAAWSLFPNRRWQRFVLFTVLLGTLFNLQVWRTGLPGFQIGLMDLTAARRLTIRSDIQTINHDLSPDDRILMVGEAEVFDVRIPVAYNTVFDESLFEQWTADSGDNRRSSAERRLKQPRDILAELNRRHITHVYVNWLEILRYRRPGSYGYCDYVTPARFRQLVRSGVLSEPTVLLHGLWDDLPPSDRRVVSTWDGFEDLLTEAGFDGRRRWQPVRIYRVITAPDPVSGTEPD